MAKKSLKKRIDDLVDALGGAEKPTFAEIRNELVSIGAFAEALENEQALAEKDARIADLEAQLGSVQVALQTASAEIKAFRAQQKKQEEEKKRQEVPEIQFKILQRLGSPASCKWLNLDEIARSLKIEIDEAEVYVEGLEKLGLIFFHPHEPGGGGWLRSPEGNKLAVAKRWAGEEGDQKQHKYADLPAIQHEVLVIVGSDPDGVFDQAIAKKIGATLPLTVHTLKLLRKADMATDGGDKRVIFGDDGSLWWTMEKGEEYLAERDLL